MSSITLQNEESTTPEPETQADRKFNLQHKIGWRLRVRIDVFMQNAAAIWPGNDLAATADAANRKKCDDHVAEFATMFALKLGTMITGR